jgi:hypothetical protein
MSYAQYGLIQAADLNTFAGGNPTTTSGTLNAVWATGGGSAGYGQTALANVSAGQSIAAVGQWATLISNCASAASHQGTSISSISVPVAGGTITYHSALPTNLTAIYTGRLNATAQGSTTANTATYGSTWSAGLTFTHTATFVSGDAARYFFNAGGQIAMTVSHPSGTGINLLFNNLASNVGTVVLSAPTSGSITVAGTSYNGVTKVGGGGNAPSTLATNSGYYSYTTANSNTTIFTQTASTGPSGYLSTFIRFIARTNGPIGSNSDCGNVITIYTVWDEVPDGLVVSTGSATTMTIRPPSTTNIANTWGAIGLSGTVTGS